MHYPVPDCLCWAAPEQVHTANDSNNKVELIHYRFQVKRLALCVKSSHVEDTVEPSLNLKPKLPN